MRGGTGRPLPKAASRVLVSIVNEPCSGHPSPDGRVHRQFSLKESFCLTREIRLREVQAFCPDSKSIIWEVAGPTSTFESSGFHPWIHWILAGELSFRVSEHLFRVPRH